MITINKSGFACGCAYTAEEANEFRGLSTDTKPQETANGSIFLEIDTGNVFCFDAENKAWLPW